MLLPVDRSVLIRGTVTPGAEVTVEFATQKKKAVSDKHGRWMVVLEPMPASHEPRTLTISSAGTSRRFCDVLVGAIWLCARQSNMAMVLESTAEKQAAKEAIGDVEIRHFNGKNWVKVTPRNMSELSAVGVWFAMEMARRQKEPVGIFVAARGGTAIDA